MGAERVVRVLVRRALFVRNVPEKGDKEEKAKADGMLISRYK